MAKPGYVMNPISKRQVKIGSATYKKLVKEGVIHSPNRSKSPKSKSPSRSSPKSKSHRNGETVYAVVLVLQEGRRNETAVRGVFTTKAKAEEEVKKTARSFQIKKNRYNVYVDAGYDNEDEYDYREVFISTTKLH